MKSQLKVFGVAIALASLSATAQVTVDTPQDPPARDTVYDARPTAADHGGRTNKSGKAALGNDSDTKTWRAREEESRRDYRLEREPVAVDTYGIEAPRHATASDPANFGGGA